MLSKSRFHRASRSGARLAGIAVDGMGSVIPLNDNGTSSDYSEGRLFWLFLVAISLIVLIPSLASANERSGTTREDPEEDAVQSDISGKAYEPQLSVRFGGRYGFRDPNRRPIGLIREKLRFRLANRKAKSVRADVSIKVQAHGRHHIVELGSYLVPARQARPISVAVQELGIDAARLQTSAALTLLITTWDPRAGEVIDGQTLPTLYLHRIRGRSILYGEESLLRYFNGGDFDRRYFVGIDGADLAPGQIKIFAGEAEGDPDPDPFAPPPSGDDIGSGLNKTVCVRWNHVSNAHGAGEDYYANGESMAARGVKITVSQQADIPTSQTRYANAKTGCASFLVDNQHVMLVTIEAEARLGEIRDILVRARERLDCDSFTYATRKWSYFVAPSESKYAYLFVPAGRFSTLMANATFAAYRFDKLAHIGHHDATLDVIFNACTANSYASDTGVNISHLQYENKFVYGHEIGHWYAHNYGPEIGSLELDTNYDYPRPEGPCLSGGGQVVGHLLRSAEFNASALAEGLGQFFSTAVWNNIGSSTPAFRYYKDVEGKGYNEKYKQAYQDLIDNDYRVDMRAATDALDTKGGVRNWRDNMCVEDDPDEASVELDWARFFINYLSGLPQTDDSEVLDAPKPSFQDLMEHLIYMDDNYYKPGPDDKLLDVYDYLESALQDPELSQQGFLPRWQYFAESYGVALP